MNTTARNEPNSETETNRPLEWADLWTAMDKNPTEWVPTTASMYNDMLEVLPPAGWIGGAFLVGEPHHHDAEGYAVFACFRKQGDKYAACYMNRKTFRETFHGRNLGGYIE